MSPCTYATTPWSDVRISYENDLFEVFQDNIVPSGVAELSHLQQMGYTYIKPEFPTRNRPDLELGSGCKNP